MANQKRDEELLDMLERARETGDPAHDIAKAIPNLTPDDAYRLQLGLKKRLAQRGDAHVGYRLSMTSRTGMAESIALGILTEEAAGKIQPVFTSLSASNLGSATQVIKRDPNYTLYAEAEVAMVMGRRLQGPHVTAAQARQAVGGLYAGLDMAQIPKNSPFGFLHKVASACAPVDTQILLGSKMTEPTIDLRLEGILVSVNGQPRASATAWESLGDPLNGVAWLANELAKQGAALEPGQIVITGVCPYPQRLGPGDVVACAEFTRLGTVTALVSVE